MYGSLPMACEPDLEVLELLPTLAPDSVLAGTSPA